MVVGVDGAVVIADYGRFQRGEGLARLSVARMATLPRFGEHAEYLGGAERRS
jgi:hypothetical protein